MEEPYMDNNLYLIHEEDYIKHIDEKVLLYSFVIQLTHHIAKLKPTCENEKLIKMAKYYETSAENLFSFWGIPKSYLVYDNKEDLTELMENELIEPEEAGFYPCGNDCSCNCAYCCESEDDETGEEDEFAEMMEALSAFIHSIFGDNVSVHIVLE